jgi:hypothetical protein
MSLISESGPLTRSFFSLYFLPLKGGGYPLKRDKGNTHGKNKAERNI